MISHVHIGIADFDRAFAFYAMVLPVLGLALKFEEPQKGWAGWMSPGVAHPLFLIGLPYDCRAASPGNGQMVALLAPNCHPNYYGAYFRDPDGNELCVCCHQPEPA